MSSTEERLVLGPRAVRETLQSRRTEVHLVYVQRDGRVDLSALADDARRRGYRVEPRDRAELDALAGAERHQGAIAVVGAYPYVPLEAILTEAPAPPLLLALDQITDPHNFGALIRSAVVFGVDGIVTLTNRAAPVTAAVVRTSAGATEHARIARVVNLARALAFLADEGLQVVGLDGAGPVRIDSLPDAPTGRVLVVGAEGKGLRRLVRERCELLARIPQSGPVASLNASVAGAIAMYAASTRR